jgi:hypothetical protein
MVDGLYDEGSVGHLHRRLINTADPPVLRTLLLKSRAGEKASEGAAFIILGAHSRGSAEGAGSMSRCERYSKANILDEWTPAASPSRRLYRSARDRKAHA